MTAVKQKIIYFITGASGVGKTTLLNLLEAKYGNKPWAFLHFDKIGVPTAEEMVRDFGSGTKWQEAKTYEWIAKLIQTECERVFFEGQVNLQFIRGGFAKHGFENYFIVLVDCSDEIMTKRLVHYRNQPELVTTDMLNWLKFLRNQAKELNVTIIDNSHLTKQELLKTFEESIGIEELTNPPRVD